jgi:hypothetical protein
MARALTIVLLTLAMANVAYGDLVRPCLCGPDNPDSCGFCPASRHRAEGAPAQTQAQAPTPC